MRFRSSWGELPGKQPGDRAVDKSPEERIDDLEKKMASMATKVAEIEKRRDQVPTVTLGPIVRYTDGYVRLMTQNDAVQCAGR